MTSPEVTAHESPARELPAPVLVLVGVGAATAGLLPWLATGIRLPLQNLWAAPTLSHDMPVALLPFNQYTVLSLFGMLVLPGALVGLTVRRWPGRRPRRSLLLAAAGLTAVQVGAVVQTLVTVAPGLRPGTASQVYLAAITAAIIGSVCLSVAVGYLIALGSASAVTPAAVVGSIATGYWFRAIFDVGDLGLPSFTVLAIHYAGLYGPAILTGLALAWCGWTPPRRLLTWAAALLVLWAGTAVLETILSVVSTRVELGDPRAMIENGRRRLIGALAGGWRSPAVAVAFAAVVAGASGSVAHRARRPN